MRKTWMSGAAVAIAAALMVWAGDALDLDLESTALLGGALGAVVALVPDRTPLWRLVGFGGGFVVAWFGYVARATMLPDSSAGRATAVLVVVLACTAIAASSLGRIPLWSTLLGTAALTGAYELTYAAAPPELLSTSSAVASTLFLSLALGFCVAGLFGMPGAAERPAAPHTDEPTGDPATDERLGLTEMMENSK